MPRLRTSLHRMLQQYDVLAKEADLDCRLLIASPELWDVDAIPGRPGLQVVKVGPVHRQDAPLSAPQWLGGAAAGHALPLSILSALRARRRLRAAHALLLAEFKRLEPDVLMMPGDRELGFVQPALKAARDLGIPTLISEMGVPNPAGQLSTRRGEERFKLSPWWRVPVLNRVAAALYPRQVYPGSGERILFSPGWLTLVLARERMISDTPWVQGGGPSSAILCASPARAETLSRYGVPRHKIIVTGDCAHDLVHRALQSRAVVRAGLGQRHGLDPGRLLVVAAVPHFAEHNLLPWAEHLDGVDKLCAALAASGCSVVLSLHPKSDRARYQPIAERHGLPIHDGALAEILPAADVFVAGGSSTIEWAVLCGIPVINVNYARLPLEFFQSYGGVQTIEKPDETLPALQRLARDPAWLRSQQDAQRAAAADLALFDGKSGSRIVEAVRRLAGERSRASRHADAGASLSSLVPQAGT